MTEALLRLLETSYLGHYVQYLIEEEKNTFHILRLSLLLFLSFNALYYWTLTHMYEKHALF